MRGTPLVKAYDLFNEKMKEDAFLSCDKWVDGGAVSNYFGDRMRVRFGNGAVDAANSHLDQARRGGSPPIFVYDFVAAATPFAELKFTFDAQRAPLTAPGEAFEDKYGSSFPRQLAFQEARNRTPAHIAWFNNIYV